MTYKRNNSLNQRDRWAPVLSRFNFRTAPSSVSTIFGDFHEIFTNTSEANMSVPYVAQVKNAHITCDVITDDITVFRGICVYLMKIPGYVDTDNHPDLPEEHPEWVVAYKYIGQPTLNGDDQDYQPIRINSRKRVVLYSGDKLGLFISGDKDSTTSVKGFRTRGVCSYQTRIN